MRPRRTRRPSPARLVAVIAVVAVVAASGVLAAPAHATPPVRGPVIGGEWADPEVVQDPVSGRWYSYATNFTVFGFEFNVPVRSSPDLGNWSTFEGDALPTLPSWASPSHTWAPGVARIGAQWTLFFTARHTASGHQCIGVATGTSPDGPFTSAAPEPLVCQVDLGGSIDPSPFVDPETGQWWLHWKSDENTHTGEEVEDPNPRLWASRLGPGGTTLLDPPTAVLAQTHPVEAPLVEAPDMVFAAETYWLFYSAARWQDDSYFGHWARCSTPAGPCTKLLSPSTPWLGTGSGVPGPGAASLAPVGVDRWVVLFQGWTGAVGYAAGGNRSTFAEPVTFDGPGGQPRLRPDLPRAPTPTDDDLASSPAVAGSGPQRLEVWRGVDRQVWSRVGSGPPAAIGGLALGRPDVAVVAGNGPVIVTTGVDRSVWLRARVGPSWGPWRSLGGGTEFSPSVASWANGRLDVFITGLDAALWHRWSADAGLHWSAWTSLGGVLTSSPDATTWGPERLDVVARGTDSAVWHQAWSRRWLGWTSLGGSVRDAPSVAASGFDRLDVAARGLDDAVWHRRWAPGWTAWRSIGGRTDAGPDVGSGAAGVTVVVRGLDVRSWRTERASGAAAFGPWTPTG